ncbi:hypothetical protein AK812_SmicGene40814 [Symbiodinium microadriaticum]|uniref:RRM domain-containing protein n=1 Tax=Symbiodinium microadriaticum TaxID=2951 RepID=A0A1Q9C7Q8_SYMMI|nr:hypothetical protein AK812_SmicGene40814 [Symbiodinium microadriaticum]
MHKPLSHDHDRSGMAEESGQAAQAVQASLEVLSPSSKLSPPGVITTSSLSRGGIVLLLRDMQQRPTGKAYVRFKSHSEALKALEAIAGVSGADGVSKASWSESERALRGTRGAYGLNMLQHLQGAGGGRLQEICQAAGASSLYVELLDPVLGTLGSQHVLFAVRCAESLQAEECWKLLAEALARVHEAHVSEVRGSLVLRGFPSSWSEKGLNPMQSSCMAI